MDMETGGCHPRGETGTGDNTNGNESQEIPCKSIQWILHSQRRKPEQAKKNYD